MILHVEDAIVAEVININKKQLFLDQSYKTEEGLQDALDECRRLTTHVGELVVKAIIKQLDGKR